MTSEVIEPPPAQCQSRAVPRADTLPRSFSSPTARAGELLRAWRTARGVSQFELALQADVSARHLSYIETGKAQPSREMIIRLSEVLRISLRERNALLSSAGYAPLHRQTPLVTPTMAPVRRAIDLILRQQAPYPAFVTNRHWDVLSANDAMSRLLASLKPQGAAHANILHQVFDPDDMRPLIANWEEVATDLLAHLHSEVASAPLDARLRDLRDAVLAYPGVPKKWGRFSDEAAASPVLTVVFRKDRRELRFFSTITTFATPRDVTVEDVRIECMFPLDADTDAHCRDLAEQAFDLQGASAV